MDNNNIFSDQIYNLSNVEYNKNVYKSINDINSLISTLYYKNPNAPKGKRVEQDLKTAQDNIAKIVNTIMTGTVETEIDKISDSIKNSAEKLYKSAISDREYKRSDYSPNMDKEYRSAISKIQGALQRTTNALYRDYIENTIGNINKIADLTTEKLQKLGISDSKTTRNIIEGRKRDILNDVNSLSKMAKVFSNQSLTAINNFADNVSKNIDTACSMFSNSRKVLDDINKISRRYKLNSDQLAKKAKEISKSFDTRARIVPPGSVMSIEKDLGDLQKNFSKYSAKSVINRIYSGGVNKGKASSFNDNYLSLIKEAAKKSGRDLVVTKDARGEYVLAFPSANTDPKQIDWKSVPKFKYGTLNDKMGLSMQRNGGRAANNIVVVPSSKFTGSGYTPQSPNYLTTAEYMLRSIHDIVSTVKPGKNYEKRLRSALSIAERNALRGTPYDYAAFRGYEEASNENMSRRASLENAANRLIIRPVIDTVLKEMRGAGTFSTKDQESDVVKGLYDLIGAYRAQKRGGNAGSAAFASLSRNELYGRILSSSTAKEFLKDISDLPLAPQYGSNAARAGGFIQLAANLENAAAALGWDASRHISQGTNFGDLTERAMKARRSRNAPIFKTTYGLKNNYNYDDETERLYRVQYVTEKEFIDKWNKWAAKNPELAASVGILPGLHDNASIMRSGIEKEFESERQRHRSFSFEEYNRAQRKLTASGIINKGSSAQDKYKAVIGYLMGIDPKNVVNPLVYRTGSGFDASFNEIVQWSNPKTLGRYTGYRSEASFLPNKFFRDAFAGVDVLRGIEEMSANDLGGLLISRLTDIYLDPKSDKDKIKGEIGKIFAGTKYADVFDIKDNEIVAKFLGEDVDLNKDEQKKVLDNIRKYFPNEKFTIQEGLNAAYDYRWLNDVRYGERELEAIERAAGPDAQKFAEHYRNFYKGQRQEAANAKKEKYQEAFRKSFQGGNKGINVFDITGDLADSPLDYQGPFVTKESYDESNLKKFYESMGANGYGIIDLGPFGYKFSDQFGNEFSSSQVVIPNMAPESVDIYDRLGGETEGSIGYRLSSFDESLNSVIRSLAEYQKVLVESKDDTEAIQKQYNKTSEYVDRFMSEYKRYALSKDSPIIDEAFHARMPGGKFFEAAAVAMGQDVVGGKDAVFLSEEAMRGLIGTDRSNLSAIYQDLFGKGPSKKTKISKIQDEIINAITLGSGNFKESGALLQMLRFPSIQGQDVRFLRAFVDSTMKGSEVAKIGYGAAESNRTDYDRDHFALVSAFLGMGGMNKGDVSEFIEKARDIQKNHQKVSEALAYVRKIRGEDASIWKEDLMLPSRSVIETASFAGAANRGQIGLISSQATEARRFLDKIKMSEKTGTGTSAAIGQMARYLFESAEQDAISYKHIINRLNKDFGDATPEEFAAAQTEVISLLGDITGRAWDKSNQMSLREYFTSLKNIGIFKDMVSNKAFIQMAQQASQVGGQDFKDVLLGFADQYIEKSQDKSRSREQIVNDFLAIDESGIAGGRSNESRKETIGTIPFEMLMLAADYLDTSVSAGGKGSFLHQALVSKNRLEGDMSMSNYSVGRWLRDNGAIVQKTKTETQRRVEAVKKAVLSGQDAYTVDGKKYEISTAEKIAAGQSLALSDKDWETLFEGKDPNLASAVLAMVLGRDQRGLVSGFSPIAATLNAEGGHFYSGEGGVTLTNAITASKLGSILSGKSGSDYISEFIDLLDKYEGTKFSVQDIAKHGYTTEDIKNFGVARRTALYSIFGTLQHKEMETLGEALDVSMDQLLQKDKDGNLVLNKDLIRATASRVRNEDYWKKEEERLKKLGYKEDDDNNQIGRFLEASVYSTLSQAAIAKNLGYQIAAKEFSVGALGKTALADRYFAGTIDQIYYDEKNNKLVIGDSKNKSGRDDFSQLMQLSFGRYALSKIKEEMQGENFLGAAKKYGLVDENGQPTKFAQILKNADISSEGMISRFNPSNDKTSAYKFKLLSNEKMEQALSDAAAGVVYSKEQQDALVASAEINEVLGSSIASNEGFGRAIDIFYNKQSKQMNSFINALSKRNRLQMTLERLALRGETDSYAYMKAFDDLAALEGEGGALYVEDGRYMSVDAADQEQAKRFDEMVRKDTEESRRKAREEYARRQKSQKMFSGGWWANDIASGPANAFSMLFRGGVTTRLILKFVNDLKKVVQITEQLNASMTNLRIITGKSKEEANGMMQEYNKLAKELGTTTAAIAQVGAEWLRQGYNIQETEQLIEASTKLAKLGFMDQGAAVKSLTAAMKGFNLSATESMSIVDKLTTLDAKYATTAGDIATALTKVAAVANNAGMSLDETSAAITAIIDTTQQDAASVGTALKTMLSRYGNVKAGSFAALEGSEEGDTENINDIERVLGALGIQIRTSKMEMRDFSDVLSDIADKWITLTTVEQNAVATAVAGVRQRNAFNALMQGWSQYSSALEDQATSAGRADLKYEAYKDSIEYRKQQLQAAWEGLVERIDQSEVLKGIFAVVTKMVEWSDKWAPILASAIPLFKVLIDRIRENTDAERQNTNALNNKKGTSYSGKQIGGMIATSMISSGISYGISGGGLFGNIIDEKVGTSAFENGGDSLISGLTAAAGSGIGAAIGTMIAPGIGTAIGSTLGPLLLDPLASLFKWIRHRDEIEMAERVAEHKETLKEIQKISSSFSSLQDAVDTGAMSWSSADWKRNQAAYEEIIDAFESNAALREVYKNLFGSYDGLPGDVSSATSEQIARLNAAQIIGEATELYAASETEISELEKKRIKTLSKISEETDREELKKLNQRLDSIDADLREYQDALQRSYLAASVITSGISQMSSTQINNATLERVIRQVADEWAKNNPNVFLSGTLTASARQDIINYLRGEEQYSALFRNKTQTLSSRIRAGERARNVFGGENEVQAALRRLDEFGGYNEIRDKYGDSGIDLLYKADVDGIERIAHALNMTAEQAINAEKSLGWVTDATIANGIDGLVDSFSGLGSILTEISHSSTISAKTMNNILDNYSWLLEGDGGSFGTDNIMQNLMDLFTGNAMEGVIGIAAKAALTNDQAWSAFIQKYNSPEKYGAIGLSEDDWLEIQGSSNLSGAANLMFNNKEAFAAFAKLAGDLTGDLEIAEVIRKILVEAEDNALQNEISNLESVKESLEDVNKQREKELELIKAKQALENAQKEKKQVYREGIGFVYTTDQQAVKDAQENVEKLEREKNQNDVQYQIDILNQQKDILSNIEKNEQLESIYKLLEGFMDGKDGSVLGHIMSLDKADIAKKVQEGVTASLNENTKKTLQEEADAADEVYKSILMDLDSSNEDSWINKGQDSLGGSSVQSVLKNNKSAYYDVAKQMYSDKLNQLSTSYAKLANYNEMGIDRSYDISGYSGIREYFNNLGDQNRWLRVYIPDGEGWAHSQGARDAGVMMYYSKIAQDQVPSDLERGKVDKLLLGEVKNGVVSSFSHANTFDDLIDDKYIGYIFVNTDTSNEYGYYKGADGWHEIRLQNGDRELSPPGTLKGVNNYNLLRNAFGSLSFSGGSTLINERGLEGIITPQGTITSLPAKSGILPADLTKNLWALGKIAPNLIAQLTTPSFSRIDDSKTEDNSMHVGTLNATFNTDSSFDSEQFWRDVRSEVSLTKNNRA